MDLFYKIKKKNDEIFYIRIIYKFLYKIYKCIFNFVFFVYLDLVIDYR